MQENKNYEFEGEQTSQAEEALVLHSEVGSESARKVKKRFSWLNQKLLTVIALVSCITLTGIGMTVAYLTATAGPVEASFTIGNIKIQLKETTGSSYQLIPGKAIAKDPKVTVLSGSEACWLFVKITKTTDFDGYMSYDVADGWTHLGGYGDVYYRQVDATEQNLDFSILKDNVMVVRDTLTEEKMSAITEKPTISFTAYAVQSHTVDDVMDAWFLILEEDNR